MAKIILKGIVKQITAIETYGSGDSAGKRQSLILFVPAYVDFFGDKKGEDEEWQLDLFNDKIQKMGLNDNLLEKRVEATVYVGSRKFQRREDNSDMWMIGARLGDLKLHEPNQTSNQTQTSNAGSNW